MRRDHQRSQFVGPEHRDAGDEQRPTMPAAMRQSLRPCRRPGEHADDRPSATSDSDPEQPIDGHRGERFAAASVFSRARP